MIEIITPAESTRLTTLDAVKADLGITGSASDDALGTLIDQFSETIAAWCGRTFGLATVRESRDITRLCDRRVILLERWPVASVDSVSVTGIALAPADYVLDPAKGELRYRASDGRLWLWPVGDSVITYRTGYALPGETDRTLPHDIERACILMVRSAWHGIGRNPALRSEETAGVATFTYFAANGDALSLEAQALLSPYRSINVG
ncbi:MAG: phage head-tail connector protein [Bosea sp.]|uniref:phage head-tail connector protein n=1 Tax=Bosea sp. (in: a-proteobacteria) TaxID=1871050 RepID=UPI001AC39605|nr:phage head-tail connector protein [Bosea sp. (in: a-proteobacteria)]MBN9471889.1 phage head-tail connector protein [Bosea sp. (in: a-proteobacteria)]